MESPDPPAIRELLGMDYAVLHGEQGFSYHSHGLRRRHADLQPAHRRHLRQEDGALEFVVRKTRVTNQRAELVAELRCVIGGAQWLRPMQQTPLVERPASRRRIAAAGAAAHLAPGPGAVLRRLRRPQPDPRGHRFRQSGRHARRVRARHAVARPGSGRLLTNWVPQQAIRSLDLRFVAITHVGERITCTGTIAEKFEQDGQRCVRLRLATTNQAGVQKLTGEALVAWPQH